MRRTCGKAITIVGLVTMVGTVNLGTAEAARPTKPTSTTVTTTVTTTVAAPVTATSTFSMPRGLAQVSTNPWAAAQATAKGKSLGAVSYVDGQVYVGYGDWDANTGPTHVTSWSPQTGGWTDHLTADTEAIDTLRQIGDTTYVPMTDPRANTADVARSGAWQSQPAGAGTAAFEHTFDVAETADGLWLVGSKRDTGGALVMRSTDGGTTWTESLLVPGINNRFYAAAVLDGVLHVQDLTSAYRFEDGAWVAAPLMASSSRVHNTVSVAGRVASVGYFTAGWLYTFDGTTSTQSSETDWLALTSTGDTVYALRSGSVVSSTDLVTWSTVSRKVPAGATSLAVGGGYLWFGTATGGLWSAPI